MDEILAFTEVEPDNFKPTEECTREEIESAAIRLMGNALMLAKEAAEDAERFGHTPINAEMIAKSDADMKISEALAAYVGMDLSGGG